MNGQAKAAQEATKGRGLFAAVWKHRLWWMLPLAVLLLLLGGIYVLGHLSKTDSEMYPTSAIQCLSRARLC